MINPVTGKLITIGESKSRNCAFKKLIKVTK